jgi:hypothetical protein
MGFMPLKKWFPGFVIQPREEDFLKKHGAVIGILIGLVGLALTIFLTLI